MTIQKKLLPKWKSYLKEWENCQRCNLCTTRTQTVHFRGTIPAPLVFIGEAPGEMEDALGQPFIGPAGHLLTSILSTVFVGRSDHPPYAIINTLACIPKDEDSDENFRAPSLDELKACAPRVSQILDLIQPSHAILLGKTAERCWKILYPHGNEEIVTMPIWHPSYVLRQGGLQTPAAKKVILQIREFLTLHNLLP